VVDRLRVLWRFEGQESCDVSGRIRNAVDIKALALSSKGSSGKRAASKDQDGSGDVRSVVEGRREGGLLGVALCLSPPLAVGRERLRVLTLLVDSRHREEVLVLSGTPGI